MAAGTAADPRSTAAHATITELPTVWLLDYGAGNIQSIKNAIGAAGYAVKDVKTVADIEAATVMVFPGVGAFGAAMATLEERKFVEPLKRHIAADKPFLGICIGMQTLFEGSAESPGVAGLGVIPGTIGKFTGEAVIAPQIGWNGLSPWRTSPVLGETEEDCRAWSSPADDGGAAASKMYFVHSYRAEVATTASDWILSSTDYGGCRFVSSVHKGNVAATQFHPEKSGALGIKVIKRFLDAAFRVVAGDASALQPGPPTTGPWVDAPTTLAKRIVACLDVRSNDDGDLVVTKGQGYDVRERDQEGNPVRNMGKPVALAGEYYDQGADEVCFLNITAFRNMPLDDQPMLRVLEQTAKSAFVPLTVGGGITDYTEDGTGTKRTALEVAAHYFRAGADKVSIGSDAVRATAAYRAWEAAGSIESHVPPRSSIEQIAEQYGSQAVVISVDPRREYVTSPGDAPSHHVVEMTHPSRYGKEGQRFAWYMCTVSGGRKGSDVDAFQLAQTCAKLGAGELLINCVDQDGSNAGFDIDLMRDLCAAVDIPVVASSGAGSAAHFAEVFQACRAEAALAAGIFHRKEVTIAQVKAHLRDNGIEYRGTIGVAEVPVGAGAAASSAACGAAAE